LASSGLGEASIKMLAEKEGTGEKGEMLLKSDECLSMPQRKVGVEERGKTKSATMAPVSEYGQEKKKENARNQKTHHNRS